MQNSTYISPKIQNEIVATCGDIIFEDITNRITKSGFFSVLTGETNDVAEMTQLSVCIRYVDNVEKEGYRVRENFIGFAPVKDKTGPGIKAATIKGLHKRIWILVISWKKVTTGRVQGKDISVAVLL
jgi:hypothetical protein